MHVYTWKSICLPVWCSLNKFLLELQNFIKSNLIGFYNQNQGICLSFKKHICISDCSCFIHRSVCSNKSQTNNEWDKTNVSSCKIMQNKALNWENKLISSRSSNTEITLTWQHGTGLLFLSVLFTTTISSFVERQSIILFSELLILTKSCPYSWKAGQEWGVGKNLFKFSLVLKNRGEHKGSHAQIKPYWLRLAYN